MPASAASTSYTTNSLNQYSAVGAVTPTYDADGNLTFDGSFTYCYDTESRLTAILSAGSCASPTTVVATGEVDSYSGLQPNEFDFVRRHLRPLRS